MRSPGGFRLYSEAADATARAATWVGARLIAGDPVTETERAGWSRAASHGLRPGDVIVSVNGAPPFVGGIVSEAVVPWTPGYATNS